MIDLDDVDAEDFAREFYEAFPVIDRKPWALLTTIDRMQWTNAARTALSTLEDNAQA